MRPRRNERGMTTYILDGLWGTHARWEGLRSRIQSEIGPCRIWRYDNSGCTSIEKEADSLRAELIKSAGPLNFVGYSMGGLVIRECLRIAPELPAARAAFLHCPHRGSLIAHAFAMLPACREMRPGSAFLARLEASDWRIPSLATWCAFDAMVVPGRSACWSKASATMQSSVPAHAWPVYSPAIHRAVVRFLLGAVGAPTEAETAR